VLFVSLSLRVLKPYEYFLPYSYLSLLYSPLDSSFLTSAFEVVFMNLTTTGKVTTPISFSAFLCRFFYCTFYFL